MKKMFLAAALALTVVGSWAFYPKAAEPVGYMMVISSGRSAGLSYVASITTIAADGQQQTQELDTKGSLAKNATNSILVVHKAELTKLNQLRVEGWRVINVTNSNAYQGSVNTTAYLLEK